MDQLNKAASDAYHAFWLALEGKAPAGLLGPPNSLQTWEQLPATVRDAWCAAVLALAPAPEETAAAEETEEVETETDSDDDADGDDTGGES